MNPLLGSCALRVRVDLSKCTCSVNVLVYSKPTMSALSICPHTPLMGWPVPHMLAHVCRHVYLCFVPSVA